MKWQIYKKFKNLETQNLKISESQKLRNSEPQNLSNLEPQQLKIVAWTVISYDWDKSLTPDDCYNNVIKNAGDGSIIVFHDSEKAVNNMLPTLTKVLEYYTDKGYTFEKLGVRNC